MTKKFKLNSKATFNNVSISQCFKRCFLTKVLDCNRKMKIRHVLDLVIFYLTKWYHYNKKVAGRNYQDKTS